MAQVCEMLVQRCIAPLSLHPSGKTAWAYKLVIGTANEWPSCDPFVFPAFTPFLPIKRRGFLLPWAYRTIQLPWMPRYAKKQDQQIHCDQSQFTGVHSICLYFAFTATDLAAWLSRFPAYCHLKDLENG